MKGTVKTGTKAWFTQPFRGAEVAEFVQDTEVDVADVPGNPYWLKTTMPVGGFPIGHPAILLNRDDIALEDRCPGCGEKKGECKATAACYEQALGDPSSHR